MSTPTLTLAQVVKNLLTAWTENQQLRDACYTLIDALDQIPCAFAMGEDHHCQVCDAVADLLVVLERTDQ